MKYIEREKWKERETADFKMHYGEIREFAQSESNTDVLK